VKGRGRVRLLFGPYQAPHRRRGDRATCLYRDCDVVVTDWTNARIIWPRCRPVGLPCSHPLLLVDAELARAIRHESAAALRYPGNLRNAVLRGGARRAVVHPAHSQSAATRCEFLHQ
jgi:hypothetical protein